MNVGPRTADALLAALLAMAIPACSTRTRDHEGASPLTRALPSTRTQVPEVEANQREVPAAGANQREVAALPKLRADYIRTVQTRAAAAYPVEPMGAKRLRLRSPAQQLLAVLSPEDVQITNTANGGARGGLALAGFGCEQPRAAVRAAAPRGEGNRGEYDRGELLESYVSGPLGLAQGFTVATPPPCRARGGGAVVVELALRGPLHAELVGEGARALLRDHAGHEAFTYADLFAHDAKGQTVAATMTVNGKRLLLHVDDAAAVYPLQIEALISTQQAKLLAPDGADYDRLGASVALSGDLALVGAGRNDERGTDAGAAYVFVRNDTSWTRQAKLTAVDGAPNDNLGVSVALSGDTALVGAMFNDGLRSDAGAAYVFVRSGTSWTQQAKLMAGDGASDDQLGISVALSGDTALVGTIHHGAKGHHAGAVYVFVRDGTRWTQQAKLVASDGAALDQFGISVAVSGDTALVGAHGDDDLGDGAGSAYVFVRSDTRWTQEAKLTAADGTAGDNFGVSVALQGDTALVGMPNDNDRGAGSGSAYVFTRGGTRWTQEAKLAAVDGTSADLFGASVALSENAALVGALGDDDLGSSSGSAYVYMPPWPRTTNALHGSRGMRTRTAGAVRLRSVRGLSR